MNKITNYKNIKITLDQLLIIFINSTTNTYICNILRLFNIIIKIYLNIIHLNILTLLKYTIYIN